VNAIQENLRNNMKRKKGLTVEEKTRQLKDLKEQALLAGGEKRIKKQHEKGKLTARERIDLLLDRPVCSSSMHRIWHR